MQRNNALKMGVRVALLILPSLFLLKLLFPNYTMSAARKLCMIPGKDFSKLLLFKKHLSSPPFRPHRVPRGCPRRDGYACHLAR